MPLLSKKKKKKFQLNRIFLLKRSSSKHPVQEPPPFSGSLVEMVPTDIPPTRSTQQESTIGTNVPEIPRSSPTMVQSYTQDSAKSPTRTEKAG